MVSPDGYGRTTPAPCQASLLAADMQRPTCGTNWSTYFFGVWLLNTNAIHVFKFIPSFTASPLYIQLMENEHPKLADIGEPRVTPRERCSRPTVRRWSEKYLGPRAVLSVHSWLGNASPPKIYHTGLSGSIHKLARNLMILRPPCSHDRHLLFHIT